MAADDVNVHLLSKSVHLIPISIILLFGVKVTQSWWTKMDQDGFRVDLRLTSFHLIPTLTNNGLKPKFLVLTRPWCTEIDQDDAYNHPGLKSFPTVLSLSKSVERFRRSFVTYIQNLRIIYIDCFSMSFSRITSLTMEIFEEKKDNIMAWKVVFISSVFERK